MFDDLYKAVRPKIKQYDWMHNCEMILVTNEEQLKNVSTIVLSLCLWVGFGTTKLIAVSSTGDEDKIVGFCLASSSTKGYYIPVRHSEGVNIPWTVAHREMCRLK